MLSGLSGNGVEKMGILSIGRKVSFLRKRKRPVGSVPGSLVVLLLLISMVGCGSGSPFKFVPVRGKVTYRDGSLIQADRIVVSFVPQGQTAVGKEAAPSATGEVNPADGTFNGLTSQTHLDGAVVGKHKVVVIALKKGPGGIEEPIRGWPTKYTKPATTPLEVEVTSGGKNYFELQIDKGP